MSTDPTPALGCCGCWPPARRPPRSGRSTPTPRRATSRCGSGPAFDARRRREAELTALVDTARDLAALRDPGGVLDAIVRRARTLLGTDVAYLTLYDAERRRHLHARHRRLGVGPVPVGAAAASGAGLGGLVASTHRPYWTADYFADERFRHTGDDRHRRRRRGPRRHLRHPAAGRRRSSSGCCSPPTGTAARSPATRWRCSARWPRSPRCRWCRPGRSAETAEALERLSEAHAVHRHTAGRARGAAHDRFAEVVLAGGGVDDITAALAELLAAGWRCWTRTGRAPGRTGPAPCRCRCSTRRRRPGRLVRTDGSGSVAVTAVGQRLGTS